jgi:hypothetical protein
MTARKMIYPVVGLLAILLFSGLKSPLTDYKNFQIGYISAGLGSQFTSMQPVFYVNNLKFVYTSEQTTLYKNQKVKRPDTLQVGKFRRSSVDSIIRLIKDIKDTLIYRTNVHVSSGAIHRIYIQTPSQKLEFNLHNDSHPTAQKIVTILNTYIPDQDKKLWLFDFLDKK